MQPEASNDITRVLLSVVVTGALLLGTVWTLWPFLSALIWATTIVVATWPMLMTLQRLTGGRRSLAAGIMTLLVLVAFIAPFAVAIQTLLDAAARSPAVMSDFLAHGVGLPPKWVSDLPWIGDPMARQWEQLAVGGPDALKELVQPYARAAASAALAATGGVGRTAVLALLTIALAGLLYVQGENAARGALAVANRLGGQSGERALSLAGQAIRGVALGVVVTALVQSLLAGIALWVCGVPHPAVLTAIAFVFGIAQIGPAPVLAAAVLWTYWTAGTGWAAALIVGSLPVVMIDNVLRPLLIRRGVQLPLLLIIAGVVGGLISFGLMGVFIGPVVLAVTYTLGCEWVATPPGQPADDEPHVGAVIANEVAAR